MTNCEKSRDDRLKAISKSLIEVGWVVEDTYLKYLKELNEAKKKMRLKQDKK